MKDGVSVVRGLGSLEAGLFLHIAKGSAAELRTQLYIARRIGVIDQATQTELTQECKEIAAMLQATANTLKTRQSSNT